MPSPSGSVLCISSHVARGSVGNRAMVFALERLGFTVIAVPTVLLPHHPGHSAAARIPISDNDFDALLEPLMEKWAGNIAGVVSGYLASAGQALAVARGVRRIKAANPAAVYVCDPVIGDSGRLYLPLPVAEAIRDLLLPIADLATPNLFECAWLAGLADGPAEAADCGDLARRLPSAACLVTSAPALMRGSIGAMLVTAGDAVLFEHPLVETPVKGTGDLLSALVLGRKLHGADWREATQLALSSVFEIVAGTAREGADEMLLGALQGSLVQPQARIAVREYRSSR